IAQATFLGARGPVAVELGEDTAPLLPVGMRTLGPGLESAYARLAESLPEPAWAEWLATLRNWYRPEARFGEAFCRLLAPALRERCPVLLDAMVPAVKSAEQPWLRRLVEERAAVATALAAAEKKIVDRGFDLQVRPQPGTSPLFLLRDGERRRIAWHAESEFS